jgi:hypothetical protein
VAGQWAHLFPRSNRSASLFSLEALFLLSGFVMVCSGNDSAEAAGASATRGECGVKERAEGIAPLGSRPSPVVALTLLRREIGKSFYDG